MKLGLGRAASSCYCVAWFSCERLAGGGRGEWAVSIRQGLLPEKPVSLYRAYPRYEVIRKFEGFGGEVWQY